MNYLRILCCFVMGFSLPQAFVVDPTSFLLFVWTTLFVVALIVYVNVLNA